MSQILAKEQKNFLLLGISNMEIVNTSRAQVTSQTQNKSKDLVSGPVAA